MHDEDHDPPGFDPARFRAAMRGPARRVVRLPPALRLSPERERAHRRRQIEIELADAQRLSVKYPDIEAHYVLRIARLKEELAALDG